MLHRCVSPSGYFGLPRDTMVSPLSHPSRKEPVSATPIDARSNVSGVAAMTPPGSLVRVRDCVGVDMAQRAGGESFVEGPTLSALLNQAM